MPHPIPVSRLLRPSSRLASLPLAAMLTVSAAAHAADVVDSASAPATAASGASARPVGPATAVAEPATIAAVASRPKDLALPALEIVGFDILLNRFNRAFGSGRDDYAVSFDSIRRNLKSGWSTDRDPFSINQFAHPYQGSMYYGFARSAGFDYWQSAGYTFAGSAFWEIFGEQTRPSRNDQVASGIGGTFLGEALYRMSNLVLERGGGMSRPWREAAATAISPSTGFNRLVFADRYGGIFSSHDAPYFSRAQLGYVHSLREETGITSTRFKPNEVQADFSIDYGSPGAKGYQYTRPFDYFNFEATASSANGIENVLTRGLLVGRAYEAGPDYRGVWGIYGSYDYISPRRWPCRRRGERPRLQLRRHAAGPARAAPDPHAAGLARHRRARVLRQQRRLGHEWRPRQHRAPRRGPDGARLEAARDRDPLPRQPARRQLRGRVHRTPGAQHGRRVLHAARPGALRLGRLALTTPPRAWARGPAVTERACPARDAGAGRSARRATRRG